jgi:hypothetical protein
VARERFGTVEQTVAGSGHPGKAARPRSLVADACDGARSGARACPTFGPATTDRGSV